MDEFTNTKMSGGDNLGFGGGSRSDLLDEASLSYLCCGLLEIYLDDDKIDFLMYADNRIEEYIGRKISRISRLISRKSSASLMWEAA